MVDVYQIRKFIMCEVTKAFAIDVAEKALAISIYECSVIELANKNYKRDYDDAHVELSAIFGQNWLCAKRMVFNLKSAKQANNAFNYANIKLGARGKFIETAERLLDAHEIVDKRTLAAIADEMDALLTVV